MSDRDAFDRDHVEPFDPMQAARDPRAAHGRSSVEEIQDLGERLDDNAARDGQTQAEVTGCALVYGFIAGLVVAAAVQVLRGVLHR